MDGVTTFHFQTAAGTVEEVLENHRRQFPKHGNDLDRLQESMALIQAGHFREAMKLALQVLPSTTNVEETPDSVDRPTAQAAFLEAHERARPLYEKAAYEIEGRIDDSVTMSTYLMMLEHLRSDPNW
jgi:hypothetical protein